MNRIIKMICILILLGLTATAVFADENKTQVENDLNDLFSQLENKTIVDELKSIIGNERLQIQLTYSDNTTINGSIVTEKNIFTQAQLGNIENPTLDIYLSAQTYLAIRESPDQVGSLLDAYNDGDITKDAHGFGKTLKFGLAGAVLKIMSWFS